MPHHVQCSHAYIFQINNKPVLFFCTSFLKWCRLHFRWAVNTVSFQPQLETLTVQTELSRAKLNPKTFIKQNVSYEQTQIKYPVSFEWAKMCLQSNEQNVCYNVCYKLMDTWCQTKALNSHAIHQWDTGQGEVTVPGREGEKERR